MNEGKRERHFGHFIEVWAAQRPARTAIHFEGKDISWAQLNLQVSSAHRYLIEIGIKRGDRVAWLGMNHPTMLVLLFALMRCGAVLMPLNYRLTAHEHNQQIADAAPSLLFFDVTHAAHVNSLNLNEGCCALPCTNIDQVQASAGMDPLTNTDPLDDDALLVYTSGTTGLAKGAVLTQRALLCNAMNSIHAHDLTSTDRVLMALPMFHVGGLNIMLTPALFVGASVNILARFEPGLFLDQITAWRPTLSLLVPATINALASHSKWPNTNFASLRLINTGSSIVPKALLQMWLDRGVPAAQVYGSTETAPIAIYLRAEDTQIKIGSAGLPAMHSEARVINSRGAHCQPNEVGEIQVRGDHVMRCYWNNPQATQESFDGAWFKTGDLAYADSDGYYWVVGRSKDMIIAGGENIYPAQIEALIQEHSDVAECAVIGLPDERWGEVPVLAVVLKEKGASSNASPLQDTHWLAQILDGKLAKFKWPRKIYRFSELPKTALGKVKKDALLELIQREKGGLKVV